MSQVFFSITSLIVSLLFLPSVYGLNISQILSQYPAFSTFADNLVKSQVADQINGRNTITILAVDNAGMSPLSGKSQDEVRMIMGLHVILDYYDVQKLQNMQNKTAILTTLFQSSGQARGQTGFLNATHLVTGGVAIGSAEPGSKLSSNLVKSVFSQPYNVSVLQVSTLIMPPGVGGSDPGGPHHPPANAPTSPPKGPTGPPTNAPIPPGAMTGPPMPGKAPTPAPAPGSPGAGSGGGSGSNNSVGAPAPAMASPPAPGGATTPTGATSPAGATTPVGATAPAPGGTKPAADAPQGQGGGDSSATRVAVCSHVLVVFLMLLSILKI